MKVEHFCTDAVYHPCRTNRGHRGSCSLIFVNTKARFFRGMNFNGRFGVSYTTPGHAVDFGEGVSSIVAEILNGRQFAGRILSVHIDAQDGPVIAELTVSGTQGFEPLTAPVQTVKGVHDVFLTCSDGGFNLRSRHASGNGHAQVEHAARDEHREANARFVCGLTEECEPCRSRS